jgi:hypothetical protein
MVTRTLRSRTCRCSRRTFGTCSYRTPSRTCCGRCRPSSRLAPLFASTLSPLLFVVRFSICCCKPAPRPCCLVNDDLLSRLTLPAGVSGRWPFGSAAANRRPFNFSPRRAASNGPSFVSRLTAVGRRPRPTAGCRRLTNDWVAVKPRSDRRLIGRPHQATSTGPGAEIEHSRRSSRPVSLPAGSLFSRPAAPLQSISSPLIKSSVAGSLPRLLSTRPRSDNRRRHRRPRPPVGEAVARTETDAQPTNTR